MLHRHRAPTLQFWLQAAALRPPRAHPDVDGAAAVLDGRAQHGDGVHPGRRRLLGGAGDVRARARPWPSWPASGSPSRTRSPTRPARSRSTRTGPTTDLSSLTLRVRQVGLRPAPVGHRRHGLDHAGRLRPVRDLRRSSPATAPTTPRELHEAAAWAGSCPATGCGSSTPTPAPSSAPDEDGELAIAGPTLMQRYLGKTAAECFDADGFFHTGDAGSVDADGYVHFDRPAHRDDQDRRRQRVARRARGAAAGLPAGEAGPHRRRARRPPRPARRGLHHPQGRRRGHRGRHPVVPPRAGGRLQGAQARAVLRRRRDPHDRPAPPRCATTRSSPSSSAGSPPNPYRRRAETDDHHRRPTHRRRRSTPPTSTSTWACPWSRASSRSRSPSTTSGAGCRPCTTRTRCTTTSAGRPRAASARSWPRSPSPWPPTPATAARPPRSARSRTRT